MDSGKVSKFEHTVTPPPLGYKTWCYLNTLFEGCYSCYEEEITRMQWKVITCNFYTTILTSNVKSKHISNTHKTGSYVLYHIKFKLRGVCDFLPNFKRKKQFSFIVSLILLYDFYCYEEGFDSEINEYKILYSLCSCAWLGNVNSLQLCIPKHCLRVHLLISTREVWYIFPP